jgi:MSHA biogenesis protein MshK
MATGLRALLVTLLACVPVIAAAESLPDPTRPAIDLSGSAGSGEGTPAQAAPPGLQTIIISPEYRAAIINGETVRLGGKVGDSRLVEVRESGVVLENAHGRRVLELFPKVSMKKNEAARPEKSGKEKAPGQADLPEKDAGEAK